MQLTQRIIQVAIIYLGLMVLVFGIPPIFAPPLTTPTLLNYCCTPFNLDAGIL